MYNEEELVRLIKKDAKNHSDCYYYEESKEIKSKIESAYKSGFFQAIYMRNEIAMRLSDKNEQLSVIVKNARVLAIISNLALMVMSAIVLFLVTKM